MKNHIFLDSVLKRGILSLFSSLFLLILLGVSGCTTTQTQKLVLSEPMNSDLEGRVMRETGISGAAIGAATGGVGAGGIAFLTSIATGSSAENAGIAAAIAGGSGAVVGGVVGEQKGEEKGRQIVAQAMTRDQVQSYIDGARAYNQRISEDNESLKNQMKQIALSTNATDKKPQYYKLKIVTESEMKTVDHRINEREKALDKLEWSDAEKTSYQNELSSLKMERRKLQTTYQQIEESANATSTL